MQIAVKSSPELSPNNWGTISEPEAQSYASQMELERVRNNHFVDLLNGYRRSGGLARAPEVAARFKRQGVNDFSLLAAWLVNREVISLEWQSKIWLPLFQFHPAAMALRPSLSTVLVELVVVHNDWEVAAWFIQPNPWLANATPADSLVTCAAQVLDAARAERFSQV